MSDKESGSLMVMLLGKFFWMIKFGDEVQREVINPRCKKAADFSAAFFNVVEG
ncbi:hypothetical protein ACPV5I_17865 [Vibrio gigantis]|uniref:hypothetical protein n=1 Tax=Vibrio TaxID=662 RepID=UPI003557A512